MEMPSKQQAIASNRDAWNDSARHHKETAQWQALLSAVTQADFSCLDETLIGVLNPVGIDGKDVLPEVRRIRAACAAFARDVRSGAFKGQGLKRHGHPGQQARFSVLKSADFPSILLELGFLSSERDLKRLNDPDWRASMAAAVVSALKAWSKQDAGLQALPLK